VTALGTSLDAADVAVTPAPGRPTVSHGLRDGHDERYLNRELSWLDFDARVLALAADDGIPLLERAKFLAIFSQNLDEFFQVRVAGLKDQVAAQLGAVSPDGRTASQQLDDIRTVVGRLTAHAEHLFLDVLVPALADVGIVFSGVDDLDAEDTDYLDRTFEDRIFPVLTPLAVDPGHPFPYISDLSLNLAVTLRDPLTDERKFARVKVPSILPRFVVMPDGERFVPLEQVIAGRLDRLFPGMEISGHHPFRVTRNADLTLEEEEADDLLEAVEMEIRRRRFGRAVRLELDTSVSAEVRQLLVRELDVQEADVDEYAGPLDLGGLWAVHGLDRPDLKDPPFKPVTPAQLGAVDESVDVFAELRRGELLVHHPYVSFSATTQEFLRQASMDPRVLAIKTTIYRTSGDSPVVRSLIRAAERGKQVAVLVELKARFDEAANIEWAKELEKAGVHVAYGIAGLKIHTKTTLVVREESDGIRRYCHVGTGNYNPKTARLYEDFGLLSADRVLADDLTHLFNYLTGYGRGMRFRKLLVAPGHLRLGIEALIRNEIDAGPGKGRIVLKMNSLLDTDMIDLLYEASQSGVEIDLVVRGICGLRPGVAGLSENIRVRSIIGRYLEHSRIYHFANGGGAGVPAYYIGSADLMPRNLDRRVEALVPIEGFDLQAQLREVLEVNLADDRLAWELDEHNVWRRCHGPEGIDTHVLLQERAGAQAES
jgi:polyphosphate kinase